MPVDLENSSAMSVSTVSGEASVSSSGNQTGAPASTVVKKKRNLPGMPDPNAEVSNVIKIYNYIDEVIIYHGNFDKEQLKRYGNVRDSFITHRAFCDALAEEAAKVHTILPNSKPEEVVSISFVKPKAVVSSPPPPPPPLSPLPLTPPPPPLPPAMDVLPEYDQIPGMILSHVSL
ncbi:hypothetical protein C5167_010773 [Papaver somniferum]|uniref:BIRD-IDD transcription factor fourth C2HC zinc finger domain-containing protein n=1 Tax=Papaver somniferum TaxID=3469 RepID=A0A4Y7K173_PAPSO|nr:hypothetical protein C5167_010773 [Papaver somniferum]